MEPQVSIGCMRPRRNCCCLEIVIGLFAFLLAFAVGVLIGGVTGLFAFIGTGAFTVLIALLAVILIALVIYYLCTQCRRNC